MRFERLFRKNARDKFICLFNHCLVTELYMQLCFSYLVAEFLPDSFETSWTLAHQALSVPQVDFPMNVRQ